MVYDRDSNAPSEKEFRDLGIEDAQIALIRMLPPFAQREIYNEYIRRLMSSHDSDLYDW